MFHDLTHASGFYREYFKQYKGMFDRIFMMGVSPVTLDDLSSGYNIDWNISTDETFNAMMGFSETEVRQMFTYYKQNDLLAGDVEDMIKEMKPWYDNYCFARMSLNEDRVFNCDMTLYYLNYQVQHQHSPTKMIDKAILTEWSKLRRLVCNEKNSTSENKLMKTMREIIEKGEILVNLPLSFPVEQITNIDNFCSLLYYHGLLTIYGSRGYLLRLGIPNRSAHEHYFDKFFRQDISI